MTVRPRIPLTPEQLPRQRIVQVVDLPPAPAAFSPTVRMHWMPEAILPKRRPHRMTYLGAIEWAWNPMSSRVEGYYLHMARRHWVLWIQDALWNEAEAEWQVAAYAPRRGVAGRVAAYHLVIERWRTEASENALDHFHRVSQEGDIEVCDWMAIGRAVWPPVYEPAEPSPASIRVRGVA